MKKLVLTMFGLLMVSSFGVSKGFGYFYKPKPKMMFNNSVGTASEPGDGDLVFEMTDENIDTQNIELNRDPVEYIDTNENGVVDSGDTFTFKVTSGSES